MKYSETLSPAVRAAQAAETILLPKGNRVLAERWLAVSGVLDDRRSLHGWSANDSHFSR